MRFLWRIGLQVSVSALLSGKNRFRIRMISEHVGYVLASVTHQRSTETREHTWKCEQTLAHMASSTHSSDFRSSFLLTYRNELKMNNKSIATAKSRAVGAKKNLTAVLPSRFWKSICKPHRSANVYGCSKHSICIYATYRRFFSLN